MGGCEHLDFINNTIKGVGQVGNLFYVTSYNTPEGTENGYARVINCSIIGPETASSICYAVGIGSNCYLEGNYIQYTGQGVRGQWGTTGQTNNILINNTFNGTGISLENAIVINNTGLTHLITGSNSTVIGNTMETFWIHNQTEYNQTIIFANNTINSTTITDNGYIYSKNTISQNNIIFENNTIINTTLTVTGNNNTITNNNIYSEDMYTITIDKNCVNNTIKYNNLTLLSHKISESGITYYNQTGDETVSSTNNNTIAHNNPGYTFNVTSYTDLKEVIEYIKTNGNPSNTQRYTINLQNGNYTITTPITWANATSNVHNLTINGNNQTIIGTGNNNFLNISTDYNLNINNLTIKNVKKGIDNYGTLLINKCTFQESDTAIQTRKANLYIINSIFENFNKKTAVQNSGSNLYFQNNIIRNSTSPTTQMGLITNMLTTAISKTPITIDISNNLFENNTATRYLIINTIVGVKGNYLYINNNTFQNTNNQNQLFNKPGTGFTTTEIKNNQYINSSLETTITTPTTTTLTNENYNTTIQVTIKNTIYETTVNNGQITIYINGNEYKTYNLTNQESNITIQNNALNKETNTILIAYKSTDTSYKPINTTFTINIDPTANNITTKLTTTTTTSKVQQPTNITATLTTTDNTPINGQNITITIDNTQYNTSTDKNGQATITYTPTKGGTQTITTTYNGQERYQPTETTTTLNVNKIQTTTTTTHTPTRPQINNNYEITITITDEYNNTITTGTIEIYIDNKLNKTLQIDNTNTTTTLTMTNPQQNITTKYTANDIYQTSNTTTTIQAQIFNTTTTTTPITTTTNTPFTINTQVTTPEQYTVTNGTIEYYINNQKIGQTNIQNGQATLTTTINTTGSYILTTKYNGTYVYNPSQTNTIIVVQQPIYDIILDTKPITINKIQNVTLITKVTTTDGTPVNEGLIQYYINGILTDISPVKNGQATLTTTINTTGTNKVILQYAQTNNYNAQTNKTTITLSNIQTIMNVNNITTQLAKTITLQATITDTQQNNINEGKVVFKLNGITLKDNNGNPLYAQVKNGIATLTYTLPNTWTNLQTKTITAVYSGTNIYQSTRNSQAKLHLTKDSTTPTTLTINNTITNEKTVTTTITINTNETLNTGTITLKINNKTIRDKNGKPLTAQVQNNKATLTYTLPTLKTQNYTLTATYNNPQNNKITNTTTLTIQKTNTNIQINPITTNKNENTQITAKLTDNQGNTINRTTKIAIKINGKTIKYTTAQNGIINTTINTTTLKQKNYTLTLTAGENNQYTKTTKNTTLTITQ